jgi:hypothetical protein
MAVSPILGCIAPVGLTPFRMFGEIHFPFHQAGIKQPIAGGRFEVEFAALSPLGNCMLS